MSGSFVRCLVATAVLVTASNVQAASEAPALGQSAGQPAVKIEVQPPVPAAPVSAPAKAAEAPAIAPAPVLPVTLDHPSLPASEAKGLPQPAAEQPAVPVQAPTPASAPAKTAEAPPAAAPNTALAAPAQMTPQVSPVATAKPVAPSNAGISDEERAKQILANEQRGSKPKLHALQSESPDYNIIVCEAGCGDSRAHIIYKQPVAAIRSALADPAAATAPLTKKAECRGGCDGNHAVKQASLSPTAPALLNDSAGSWLTTVEPGAPKAPGAPAAVKPQASKSLKEDWMARINRERAENKDQTAPASPSEVEVKEHLVPEPSLIREQ